MSGMLIFILWLVIGGIVSPLVCIGIAVLLDRRSTRLPDGSPEHPYPKDDYLS